MAYGYMDNALKALSISTLIGKLSELKVLLPSKPSQSMAILVSGQSIIVSNSSGF